MNVHRCGCIAMVCLGGVFILTPAPLQGQSTGTSASTSPAPSLQQALQDFQQGHAAAKSVDRRVRRKGRAEVRTAMAILLARLLTVQTPETQARIDRVLEFNARMLRWKMALVKLPRARRLRMWRWGLSPAVWPLLTAAFSRHPSQRARAARGLAAMPSSNATWVLDRLLNDPNRRVCISTLDAIWNRPPSIAMVKTLWRIALQPGTLPQRHAVFRGQVIPVTDYFRYWDRWKDGPLATRVLRHWNVPWVATRLRRLLVRSCVNPQAQSLLATPYTIQSRDLGMLLRAAGPARAAPFLLYLVNQPMRASFNWSFNGRGHFSNRTRALYFLVRLTPQTPAAYHLYYTPMYGGVWATSTATQESAMIKKIQAWYARRGIKPVTAAQLRTLRKPPRH